MTASDSIPWSASNFLAFRLQIAGAATSAPRGFILILILRIKEKFRLLELANQRSPCFVEFSFMILVLKKGTQHSSPEMGCGLVILVRTASTGIDLLQV